MTRLISSNIPENGKVHAEAGYLKLYWFMLDSHVHVDGLCSSKPKYTNEETGCYIILKKLEMTLGLFTQIVPMGRAGICQLKLRGKGVFVQFIMTS